MKASCQTLRTGLYACFSIHIAQILGHTLCFSSALSSFSLLLFPFFPLAQPQADAILSSLSILSLGYDHFLLPLPLILSPQSPLQYPTFSQVQHKSIQLHHFRLNANLSLEMLHILHAFSLYKQRYIFLFLLCKYTHAPAAPTPTGISLKLS